MGFAIPLNKLFHGPVIWRGIVYTVLMVLGKCATSVWLFATPGLFTFIGKFTGRKRQSKGKAEGDNISMRSPSGLTHPPAQIDSQMASKSEISDGLDHSHPPHIQGNVITVTTDYDSPYAIRSSRKHIYAALLLSFAMTTRGEIGFLIAAVGQSINVLAPEDAYLVVIWAVILCTLLGSIGVGIVVFYINKAATRLRVAPSQILGEWG
jgi:hypothetical protein